MGSVLCVMKTLQLQQDHAGRLVLTKHDGWVPENDLMDVQAVSVSYWMNAWLELLVGNVNVVLKQNREVSPTVPDKRR
ncbi:hypothetical protein BaRGS_00002808 [Batillaria attramentaria]|uniref:Uncharacterized protein n=1 Tax=Batillaria attramentaria TaxID=370345 RepID=A0ABD0M436_9CAEN